MASVLRCGHDGFFPIKDGTWRRCSSTFMPAVTGSSQLESPPGDSGSLTPHWIVLGRLQQGALSSPKGAPVIEV